MRNGIRAAQLSMWTGTRLSLARIAASTSMLRCRSPKPALPAAAAAFDAAVARIAAAAAAFGAAVARIAAVSGRIAITAAAAVTPSPRCIPQSAASAAAAHEPAAAAATCANRSPNCIGGAQSRRHARAWPCRTGDTAYVDYTSPLHGYLCIVLQGDDTAQSSWTVKDHLLTTFLAHCAVDGDDGEERVPNDQPARVRPGRRWLPGGELQLRRHQCQRFGADVTLHSLERDTILLSTSAASLHAYARDASSFLLRGMHAVTGLSRCGALRSCDSCPVAPGLWAEERSSTMQVVQLDVNSQTAGANVTTPAGCCNACKQNAQVRRSLRGVCFAAFGLLSFGNWFLGPSHMRFVICRPTSGPFVTLTRPILQRLR